MKGMTEKDIVAFIESENMDKTATYLQSGRRMSGFETESIEESAIGILRRIINGNSNQQDRVLLSWIVAELNLRDDVRPDFTKEFRELSMKIASNVNQADLAQACENAVQKYEDRLKNKN